MTPQKESPWIAKAPLWVIAFSLLTIACCLVLLVMRTVLGDKAQTMAVNGNDPAKASTAAETAATEPTVFHHESLIVQHEASPQPAPRQQSDDAPVANSAAASDRSSLLLAVNTRPAQVTPVVLYQTDYQNGIKGTVRLLGEAPPEVPIEVKDAPCAAIGERPMTTRFFVTDTNGGLADTLVFIADKLDKQVFPVPAEPFELVFTNCLIEPYIGAVMAKEHVVARDQTGMHHSLRISSLGGSTRFVGPDSAVSFVELTPDLFSRVSCDVHPWEFAYVSVLKHPFFAVTDEHGQFSITNIPPGGYTIQAMHRSGQNRGFGQAQKKIKVSGKDVMSVDFEITAPGK